MQVVVFASQKGGSGKTTLAGHMAVMADSAGLGPVAMLDTDPQGSLAQWWNARQAETPLFVRSSLTELPETLDALEQRGIALVCIDTPPAITVAIRSVVENADLVVVPVRPSPHDLRAAGATVDLVEGLDRPFVFVVNGASSRARITSDAAIALSQHGTVAPITVHNRTEFAASMSDGRSVMEINPEGRSTEEMGALWRYIHDRLARIASRHADKVPARNHDAFSDFVRESYQPRIRNAGPGESLGRPAEELDPTAMPARPAPHTVAQQQTRPAGPQRVVDTPFGDPWTGRSAAPLPDPDDDGFDDDPEPTGHEVRTTNTVAPPDHQERREAGAEPGPGVRPPVHPAAPVLNGPGGGPAAPPSVRSRPERLAMVAGGSRPAPAQGRGGLVRRHAFGRRGSAEI